MESIIQNPYLAFLAVIVTGILASVPGIYATWTQRKRIRAEGVKEEAEAAEIIGRAYRELQEGYKDMMDTIQSGYDDCSGKLEKLSLEVVELRKENAALKKQIKVLEQVIVDLKEEVERK